MGCGPSQTANPMTFESPFESEKWLEHNRYRLFWRQLELKVSRAKLREFQVHWRQVMAERSPGGFGADCFALIFCRCPETQQIFGWPKEMPLVRIMQEKRFRKHAMIFQDTLNLIIEALDAPNEDVCAQIVAFGSRHSFYTRRFEMKQQYWTTFGQALIQVFSGPTNNYNYSNRHAQLWRRLVQFIFGCMQIGHAIGWAAQDLPARQAFRRAIVDNELIFLPFLSAALKSSSTPLKKLSSTRRTLEEQQQLKKHSNVIDSSNQSTPICVNLSPNHHKTSNTDQILSCRYGEKRSGQSLKNIYTKAIASTTWKDNPSMTNSESSITTSGQSDAPHKGTIKRLSIAFRKRLQAKLSAIEQMEIEPQSVCI